MICIKTYLRLGETLVPIADYEGQVEDPIYIVGAIELKVGTTVLLDRKMWDLVDQLWAYFVNGLGRLCQGKEFVTYFPDQAIKVSLQTDGQKRWVVMEVIANDRRKARADFREFVTEMGKAAAECFDRLAVLVPENRTTYGELATRARTLISRADVS